MDEQIDEILTNYYQIDEISVSEAREQIKALFDKEIIDLKKKIYEYEKKL